MKETTIMGRGHGLRSRRPGLQTAQLHKEAILLRSELVDVVTVNWNAGQQLADCVASVAAVDPDVVSRFIVVDNDSTDGSADLAINWCKLIVDKVGANLGFGAACNRGARQGQAPYILFLNPDTRFTHRALSDAVDFMESAQGAGYAVAGVKLRDETGAITRNAARFPTRRTLAGMALGLFMIFPRMFPPLLMEDFDHEESRPVDHVQGAFYLVRRNRFDAVEGFDEQFFVYFEDVDLSRRLAADGAHAYFLANTEAWHRGGGTTSKKIKGKARYYGIDARLLYGQKHFGAGFHALHLLLSFVVELPASAAWYLYRYRGRHLDAIATAFRLLYANSRRILGRRARAASPFNRPDFARRNGR